MALVDRVKNILLTPKTEWPVIDAEPTTVPELYKGYIMPLAAIGPIASAIGMSDVRRLPIWASATGYPSPRHLTQAVVQYVLMLVGVFVLAIIIDALAPTFGGTPNRTQALKVAAYSYTAAWVAGIFGLIPALSILGILGLYSFYLLYLGLPVLMKSPEDKALSYTVVVILCGFVLAMVIAYVSASFLRLPMR